MRDNNALAFMLPRKHFIAHGKVLIESLRKMGGIYKKIHIFIMVPSSEKNFIEDIKEQIRDDFYEIVLFPLEGSRILFPFKDKVYAAAYAEEYSIKRNISQLLWMDIDSFFIRNLNEIFLENDKQFGYRPVDKKNIGLEWGSRIHTFWKYIYNSFDITERDLFFVETAVDNLPIYPYFNAGFMIIRPYIGLFELWKKKFDELYLKDVFLKLYDEDFRYAIFVHQAILSGAIIKSFSREELTCLDEKISFPIHLLDEMNEEKSKKILSAISCRYDTFFNQSHYDLLGLKDEIAILLAENFEKLRMAWYYEG